MEIWERQTSAGGFLWLGRCVSAPNQGQLLFLPSPFSHAVASAVVELNEGRLAILVPAACFVDELKLFLTHMKEVLSHVPGSKRIIIGWGECSDPSQSVHQPSEGKYDTPIPPAKVGDLISSMSENYLPIELHRTHQPFSRSSSLNMAFSKAAPSDLAIVLDVDMRVRSNFFMTVRAVVHRGSSIYFPICFSRYNPSLIDSVVRLKQLSEKVRRWYHDLFTFNTDTGFWVNFGYGMIAGYVEDLSTLGKYDANHQAWGMEDVDHFTAAKSSRYSIIRLIDMNLVHKWHPKSCDKLKASGDKERYRMCIGTKASSEGTNMMIALQMEENQGGAKVS